MESMTIGDALQLIDNVLASVSGTRADHVKIQTAINTINQALTPAPEDQAAQTADKKQK